MSVWIQYGAPILAAVLSGGGVAVLVQALAQRRVTQATAEQIEVDAAGRLTDSTLRWAQQLKDDAVELRQEAAEARREATDARREATDARREMANVRHEAEQLARELRQLRRAILDPAATLDRLRAMVDIGGDNGSAITDRM